MRARAIALAVGMVLVTASPASANHSFAGTAAATGLSLTVSGEEAVIGFADAKVQSAARTTGCQQTAANACAVAAGARPPLGTDVTAYAPGDPGPKTAASAGPLVTTGELGTSLDATFGEATVETTPLRDVTADADVDYSELDFTLTNTLLAEISGLGPGLQTALSGISASLSSRSQTGAIGRLVERIDALAADPTAFPMLSVEVAPTYAAAEDIDDVTYATASATGATLVVGPSATSTAIAPEGLAIIEVSATDVTVESDQRVATAEFTPASVTARVLNPATGAYVRTVVPVGPAFCFFLATALETCVTVGAGERTVTSTGGVGGAAAAAAVTISALRTSGDPAVLLRVGAVAAGVNAAPPGVNPNPNLPSTGGGPEPVFPTTAALGAVTAAAALGLLGVRRRRRAR
jgi:hypothetical protein